MRHNKPTMASKIRTGLKVKKVGTNIYTHLSYIDCLPKDDFYDAYFAARKRSWRENFDYVKYDTKTKDFTFVLCDGWDELPEPVCSMYVRVPMEGEIQVKYYTITNSPIIHGKHLFVGEGYKRFDIEEAKRRWDSYQGKDWLDKKRMGFHKWWQKNAIPRLEK